jgi:hypothetical protein
MIVRACPTINKLKGVYVSCPKELDSEMLHVAYGVQKSLHEDNMLKNDLFYNVSRKNDGNFLVKLRKTGLISYLKSLFKPPVSTTVSKDEIKDHGKSIEFFLAFKRLYKDLETDKIIKELKTNNILKK